MLAEFGGKGDRQENRPNRIGRNGGVCMACLRMFLLRRVWKNNPRVENFEGLASGQYDIVAKRGD